jgi:hypothetical protein
MSDKLRREYDKLRARLREARALIRNGEVDEVLERWLAGVDEALEVDSPADIILSAFVTAWQEGLESLFKEATCTSSR